MATTEKTLNAAQKKMQELREQQKALKEQVKELKAQEESSITPVERSQKACRTLGRQVMKAAKKGDFAEIQKLAKAIGKEANEGVNLSA